jgi:hypothetical protein
LVNQTVFELIEAGILSEVCGDEGKAPSYQPALDIDNLTIQGVVDRLENSGIASVPLAESEAVGKISSSLDGFRDALANSPKNVRLKEF